MKKILYQLFIYICVSTVGYAGTGFLIPTGSSWKYLDNGSDQGTAWYLSGFDDSSWLEGSSELGYGDAPATTVSYGPDVNNKFITTYFRKTFNVTNPSIFKSILLGMVIDDGAVVYINGVEVVRHNMPAGTILYNTLSNVNVNGHFENVFNHYVINPSLLLPGLNTIAVEVHQDAVTSSDKSFNLYLTASTEETFISKGDVWKYLDDGTNQGTAWKDVAFADGTWAQNKTILGYNSTAASRLENTTVSYGASASNKYITTYFRKYVNIPDTSLFNAFELNLYLDDGAIIYVNGTESNRINLPAGTILFNTTASSAVGTASWANYPINKSLFHNGINVIAVEVHQQSITSSDMNFEMELKEAQPVPLAGGGCTSDNIGCFTSLAATCQSSGLLVLPSTHTFQVIAQQGNPYNASAGNMPTNNDFTAYVPINGSSEHGYLSINHENNPGGVSILDLHYNPFTGLWVVDSSQAVSFSEVVKSERNCSGGITPWGTVVTSEEAVTTGDANSDGYVDIGWHVEINPNTKEVVDYNNDGLSDKLWALGRSTKENICFKNDSVTAYFGLDAGSTSYVYKFVANQPGNLSTGSLYVLKQNVYLGNSAYWVSVPNTTQSDRNNCMSISTGLGATSFNKVEDVEVGPDGKIYFTSSNEGRVYRFSDTPVINDFEIFIDKLTYSVNTGSGSSSALFNNCDNLSFDPIDGNLWVNIDGNCNYFWMARPNHTSINPQIEIFARLPSGSESTGTTFSPDGRFMFFSIQHPSANSVNTVDEAGNNYIINKATTIVVARKEDLGAMAAIPFINLGANISICQNDTITLDAGAGHSAYLWNNGATTQTIEVSAGGLYSVVVTGSNGRTNSDTVQVSVNNLPASPIANSMEYCYGESIADLSAIGANILWYADAGNDTLLSSGIFYSTGVTNAGVYDYYITQTDINGCESPAHLVNLTIYSLPSSPVASSDSVCENLPIPALTALGSNIVWYSDSLLTNQVATGNTYNPAQTLPGVYHYYVTSTDLNGCTSLNPTSVSLMINSQPSAPSITGTTVYCEGNSIQPLTTSGYLINWYTHPGGVGFVHSGAIYTPTISESDTFFVSNTSIDGCVSAETQVNITIHALPSIPVVSDIIICEGEITPDFTAAGTNIIWYTDSTLLTPLDTGNTYNMGVTNAGVYHIYLNQTDLNGCTSSVEMAQLLINSLPPVPVVSGDVEYCINESINVLTATGSNVHWYDDATLTNLLHTGSSYLPAITSTTTLYVNDVLNNCTGYDTSITIVINPLPVVSLSGLNSTYIVTSSPVTLTGTPASGVFSGTGISGTQFNPAVAGVGGPYMIIYNYTNSSTTCSNSDTAYTTVLLNVGLVSFENGSYIEVYPNPSSEQITVHLYNEGKTQVKLNLYDVHGKVLNVDSFKDFVIGDNYFVINKNELNLTDGIYYLQVSDEFKSEVIQLVFTK